MGRMSELDAQMRTYQLVVSCDGCRDLIDLYVVEADYSLWAGGHVLAQDAFPYLTEGEREILISGLCDVCWEEMNPEEEDSDPLDMADDYTYDSDWYVTESDLWAED